MRVATSVASTFSAWYSASCNNVIWLFIFGPVRGINGSHQNSTSGCWGNLKSVGCRDVIGCYRRSFDLRSVVNFLLGNDHSLKERRNAPYRCTRGNPGSQWGLGRRPIYRRLEAEPGEIGTQRRG